MSTLTISAFSDAVPEPAPDAPCRPWCDNGRAAWEGVRQPSMGAREPKGQCTWELPSVATQTAAGISPVYGATVALCGTNTAADKDRPLRTYHRAEYYDSGCTAPPMVSQWRSAHLKGLYDTADPYQRATIPGSCEKYSNAK